VNRFAAVALAGLIAVASGCAGEEWIEQELGTDARFQGIFFLDSERGWIVGGSHSIKGGIIGSTSDGGRSWSYRSGIARTSPRRQLFHLNAVHFHDQLTGLISADDGIILRTIDGGENWHEVRRGGGPGAHLSDFCFLNDTDGWVVGGDILLRTADGGASWEWALSHEVKQNFSGRAVQFLDSRLGWVVGKFGRIQRSLDGGETWQMLNSPESGKPALNDLQFVDPERGWAVGEQGIILYTADGGLSWTIQSTGTLANLTAVSFLDATHGWAVGFDRSTSSSTVIRTEDGGATWVEQSHVEGELLHALYLMDESNGWAVGERVRPHEQHLLSYEPEP
jgi:photosystem II stability/assembly factor-like uncharacterized protein